MTTQANTFSDRYLTALAFKNMIEALTGFMVLIEGDRTERRHPLVTVKINDRREELGPGTGIYRQRVELELVTKLDPTTSEEAAQELLRVNQCLYRNDSGNPNPMFDLATRLSAAVAPPYTCIGVVPVDDGPVLGDSNPRTYSYKIMLDVHCTPTR